MTYGVNRESILNSLEYFDVADECVIPDLMHDMFEGYLPYKTKLMLKHFIRLVKSLRMSNFTYNILTYLKLSII